MGVCITGATGFIGGHLAARLLQQKENVTLLVRDAKKLSPVLQDRARVVVGDLANDAALAEAVQGATAIFHCAANVHTWDKWEHYYATNVEGTRHLLQAISRHAPHARLVHVSTADVYGFPRTPCDEEASPCRTGLGYGDSKIGAEEAVRELCAAHKIDYVILRPCNVIGPGSPFIERMGKELQSGLMLKIDGGRQNMGFTFSDTLVDYMLWASKAEMAKGKIYNVRDAYDISWAEFIAYFKKAIGGKGIVLSLAFAVAQWAAACIEAPYRWLGLTQEPLLHRLIVHIFGRTCGHSAARIREHSGVVTGTPFRNVMDISIDWFKRHD